MLKQHSSKQSLGYSGFGQSIHFVISRLIAPRSRREDLARHERILNIILLASIILSGLFCLFVLYQTIAHGPSENVIAWPIALAIALTFSGLYALSRYGHFKTASYILLSLYFIATTYTVYRWGIGLVTGSLGYVLVIIVAGILISSRFAFLVTGLVSVTLTALVLLHIHGTIQPDTSWGLRPARLSDALELIIIFFVITVLTWLSNREIERSLKRARRSEAALQKERDLLEVRIAEKTKELKQIQLEQMKQLYQFAEFGRLASGFFHDLVNPLTAVSLSLEQVRSQKEKDLLNVDTHLNRTTAVLQRLQEFIQAIQKQIKNQDVKSFFSLCEEMRQVIDVLGYKARKQKVEVIMESCEEVRLWGNPIKFYQIVLNLVSNAIDSYDGVTDDRRRRVILSLRPNTNSVHLSVTDNGTGIAPELMDKIFEPMFTTKAFDKGTGLGLATAKSIIEKEFNGTIAVTSAFGSGTTFTVTLPLFDTPVDKPLLDPHVIEGTSH